MEILLQPSEPRAEEGWGPGSTHRAQSLTCGVRPGPQGPAGNRKPSSGAWGPVGEPHGQGSQDRTGHPVEFPAGKSLSRCGDSQGVGRGRRGLAEMQKHPEAGTAAAGRGPSLTERGDPKVWARGREEGRGRGAPPTCSSASSRKPGQASGASRGAGSRSTGTLEPTPRTRLWPDCG